MTGGVNLARRRIRIILGIAVLILSIALLLWGLLPPKREIRTQPISPSELQCPTPSSFLIYPDHLS
ncbi:MAG TPA: hypothetical protein VFY25_03080 [Anaerolineales bacterium]|nr:hypothetical protein [Anaerolineales bacterium]